jgi:hypothetical protein
VQIGNRIVVEGVIHFQLRVVHIRIIQELGFWSTGICV